MLGKVSQNNNIILYFICAVLCVSFLNLKYYNYSGNVIHKIYEDLPEDSPSIEFTDQKHYFNNKQSILKSLRVYLRSRQPSDQCIMLSSSRSQFQIRRWIWFNAWLCEKSLAPVLIYEIIKMIEWPATSGALRTRSSLQTPTSASGLTQIIKRYLCDFNHRFKPPLVPVRLIEWNLFRFGNGCFEIEMDGVSIQDLDGCGQRQRLEQGFTEDYSLNLKLYGSTRHELDSTINTNRVDLKQQKHLVFW